MANKRKRKAKPKTKKKKSKLVKSSRKKIKTKKKVVTKKSATKKRSKKSRKNNKLKLTKKTRGVKKMSTETIKSASSPLLDTSHLKVPFPYKAKYGNFINGKFVEPKSGKYFDNVTPINNEVICKVARSDAKDVDAALDAAHAAFPTWGKTSITERSNILLKIADVIEKLNKGKDKKEKVSINDLLIKCVASALTKHPEVNINWSEEGILQFKNADISIAVSTQAV